MALNFSYKNTASWKAIIGGGYGVSGYDAKGNYFNTNKASTHYALPQAKIATPQGLQTFVQADQKNVMGYATKTTDLQGNKTVNKPVENLSGYTVASNKPGAFDEVEDTAIVQDSSSGRRLRSSGNITLWPVIYQETDQKGAVVNSFTIPGYLPAGSLTYGKSGIPSYKQPSTTGDFSAPVSPTTPSIQAAPESPKAPVAPVPDLSSAINETSGRRRRASQFRFNTFASDLGT